MVGAGADIGFVVDGAVGIASGIILIQRARAVSGAVWFGNAEVHSAAGKQPHTVRPKILRRRQKVRRQFAIDGKAPGFDIKIAASLTLQCAGLLKICNVSPQSTQVWDCLLISGQERRAWAGWVEIDKGRESVALESRVEVVVLSGAM